MRISTSQSFDRGIAGVQNVAREVSRTQEQIASGRRVLTPADDPVAAARILRLNQENALRSQYKKNIDSVENALGLSESILDQTVSLFQRVRELALQAGSGVNTATDRRYIATEIASRLDELAQLTNTKTGSGEYIFAGSASTAPPFVTRNSEAPTYQGDQAQRFVQISEEGRVASTDSGYDIFVNVRANEPTFVTHAHPDNDAAGGASISAGRVVNQGEFSALYPDDAVIEFNDLTAVVPPGSNFSVRRLSDNRIIEGLENVPYSGRERLSFAGIEVDISGIPQPGDRFIVESTDTQSSFTTLARLRDGLNEFSDSPEDQENLKKLVADSLSNLDNGVEAVLAARAEIGSRLNTVTSTKALHEEVDLVVKGVLSELQDLDYAEAVSRLSLQSFVLEAAQRSFAKTANLSLFNYL